MSLANLYMKEVSMREFVLFLLENQGTGSQEGGGNLWLTPLIFVAIIAIFYFFMIRPQNKKQKETRKMLEALKKGDRVVTIGGIHGTIQSVKEQTVIIKIDDNTKVEFSRSAVSNIEVVSKETEIEATAEEDEKK